MADRKLAYRADSQLTITLASLATSSTLVAGRESTSYDNSSNKDIDAKISGKITTGTSPTGGFIEVWCVTPIEDTPAWPDVFDGTDSAETVTSRDILFACATRLVCIPIDTTSDRTYPFVVESLASLMGNMPDKFVIFATHSTGVNLNSTAGNHEISVRGAYETIA